MTRPVRLAQLYGRVVLIGEEPERPYERPPLSKDYLAGRAERQSVYVHDAGFYGDQAIGLRTSTRVTTLMWQRARWCSTAASESVTTACSCPPARPPVA